jgi:hypothetical protein
MAPDFPTQPEGDAPDCRLRPNHTGSDIRPVMLETGRADSGTNRQECLNPRGIRGDPSRPPRAEHYPATAFGPSLRLAPPWERLSRGSRTGPTRHDSPGRPRRHRPGAPRDRRAIRQRPANRGLSGSGPSVVGTSFRYGDRRLARCAGDSPGQRRGRDSNPRGTEKAPNGFRDRRARDAVCGRRRDPRSAHDAPRRASPIQATLRHADEVDRGLSHAGAATGARAREPLRSVQARRLPRRGGWVDACVRARWL